MGSASGRECCFARGRQAVHGPSQAFRLSPHNLQSEAPRIRPGVDADLAQFVLTAARHLARKRVVPAATTC